MKYGTILYEVRDDLDLTNNEYLLLDAVRNLQGGRQTPGWCNASIAYVAGVNRRNTFKLVERLEQKSLLESGPNPGLRRVSQTFENAIINRKKLDLYDANATKEVVSKRHQSVAAGGVEKTPEVVSKRHQDWCRKDTTTGVEKTPNITVYNTVDNTLYNDVVEQKTTTPPPTSAGAGSPQWTPMSRTTRAARSDCMSSHPIRAPGSSMKPSSVISRSAYRAHPSP